MVTKTKHANENIDDSNRKECAWNVHRFDHFHTSLRSPATIAGVIFNLFISGDVDGFLLVTGEQLSGATRNTVKRKAPAGFLSDGLKTTVQINFINVWFLDDTIDPVRVDMEAMPTRSASRHSRRPSSHRVSSRSRRSQCDDTVCEHGILRFWAHNGSYVVTKGMKCKADVDVTGLIDDAPSS